MPWVLNDQQVQDPNIWGGYVLTVKETVRPVAQRIALRNAAISFFFIFTQDVEYHGEKYLKGDALFFSGAPSLIPFQAASSFVKNGMSVAYIGFHEDTLIRTTKYTTSQGLNSVDVVILFAANINNSIPEGSDYVRLAPEVVVPPGSSLAVGHPEVITLLQSGAVQAAQAAGVTVLLDLLNNHDNSGWSEFSTETDAGNFALQLRSIVQKYNLDGIDIDDEYSNGNPILNSLVMVTTKIREVLPNIILSKALFMDLNYFKPSFQGRTLGQNLTMGYEMSYGMPPAGSLPPYLKYLNANQLSQGYFSDSPPYDPQADVEFLKSGGYGGVMVYDFDDAPNTALLGQLVTYWDGPGSWNGPPDDASVRTPKPKLPRRA